MLIFQLRTIATTTVEGDPR